MLANRSVPDAWVMPVLQYEDVPAAVRWLCAAFGLTERLRIGAHRVQMAYRGGAVIAHEGGGPAQPHQSVLMRVEDADAHCATARAHGARVVSEPTDFPFGERQYTAEDVGGHRWTFTQSIFDADPAGWGGELITP